MAFENIRLWTTYKDVNVKLWTDVNHMVSAYCKKKKKKKKEKKKKNNRV